MRLAPVLLSACLVFPASGFAAEYVIRIKSGIQTQLARSARKLRFTPQTYVVETDRTLEQLQNDPNVLVAEPNITFHAIALSNDPHLSKSWGLENTGAPDAIGRSGIRGADLHIAPVWQKGITGSSQVIVAVLDTGVDYAHPDLQGNIYRNPGEIPDNGIDDDRNGFVDDVHGWNFIGRNNDPKDVFGHGTHVAGIIGAKGNNGIGSVGVNWNVSILPVKMLGDNGSGDLASALDAVNYAVLMKASVINASWGGDSYSKLFEDALRGAAKAGVLFVAAAGNDSADNDRLVFYPAGYQMENTVSVAATDNRDELAGFSNYGRKTVEVSAPGDHILSTVPNGQYKYLSGTSMAAPFVAGLAALVKSVHPRLPVQDLKRVLLSSCDPVSALKELVSCGGRINAERALKSAGPPPQPGQPPAPKPKPPVPTPPIPIPDGNWRRVELKFESAHPYLDSKELLFPVKVPGAQWIRLHFKKLETEDFDVLYLEGLDGTVFESFSGRRSDFYSKPISRDQLKIRFLTDMSEHYFGFEVDFIEFIPAENPA